MAIFMNLGTKGEGDYSAYSVFNKGFVRILGTMTAEQFEKEIRHNDNYGDDYDDNGGADEKNVQPGQGTATTTWKPKKKGKKARRTYEDRLIKRAAASRVNAEDDWMIGGDEDEYFVVDEED